MRLGLLAYAFLGSACGTESTPSSASIEMAVDSLSCITDAEGLSLSCTSTAIVSVVDALGETIAGDCATLPAGRLVDSAQVIQETLSLGSLPSGTPLTISLSIHSGVLSPCPQANASSSAFLSGTTALVTLSEQSSGIPLLLRCSGAIGPGEPTEPNFEACDACDNEQQLCLASNGLDSCDSLFLDCEAPCFNAPDIERCLLGCGQLDSFCTDNDDGVVLSCIGDQNSCVETCAADAPPDFCDEACSDASLQCTMYQQLQSQCNEQHDGCIIECGGEASCLSLEF